MPTETKMIQQGCIRYAGRCIKANTVHNSSRRFILLTSLFFPSCICSFSISPPHLSCHTKDGEGLGQLTSSLSTMSVTTISKADIVLDIFGYIIGIIAKIFPHKTYTYTTHHLFPFTNAFETQTLFPAALFLSCQHTDQMCKCFSMLLFKSCSKRKAEWGERNIWLHSTGDQFHKFWRLHNGEKGSLACSAEGECWRHTKQHDPNELENPWPSRGLSRCYRHEKRYCFIEFRLPSLSLTRGKIYYLTIKAS